MVKCHHLYGQTTCTWTCTVATPQVGARSLVSTKEEVKSIKYSRKFTILLPIILFLALVLMFVMIVMTRKKTVVVSVVRISGTQDRWFTKADLLVRKDGTLLAALGPGANSLLVLSQDGQVNLEVPLSMYPCAVASAPDGSVTVAGIQNSAVEIAKYDFQLNEKWTQRSAGGRAKVAGVCSLDANAVAVAGSFQDSITFADAEDKEKILCHMDKEECLLPKALFVAMFSEDGTLLWQQSWETASEGLAVTGLPEGGMVAAGDFASYRIAFQTKTGKPVTLQNAPRDIGDDVCLCAYDEDGGINWARQLGGVDLLKLATAQDGSCFYVIATFSDELRVFGLNGVRTVEKAVSGPVGVWPDSIAVLAFDGTGNFLWETNWPLKRFQGPDISWDAPPKEFCADYSAVGDGLVVSYPLQRWWRFGKQSERQYQIVTVQDKGRVTQGGKFLHPPQKPSQPPPQVAVLEDGSLMFLTCDSQGAGLGKTE